MDFAVRPHTGVNHPKGVPGWHDEPVWAARDRHAPPVPNNDLVATPPIQSLASGGRRRPMSCLGGGNQENSDTTNQHTLHFEIPLQAASSAGLFHCDIPKWKVYPHYRFATRIGQATTGQPLALTARGSGRAPAIRKKMCYLEQRDSIPRPGFSEDTAMKASLLFAAGLAIAVSSIAPGHAAPVNAAASTSPGNGGTPIGCSVSTGVIGRCVNFLNFKTYDECLENRLKVGWRINESWGYCMSLGLK